MRKFIVTLLTAAVVVGIVFTGCVSKAPPEVTPPEVTPPEVTPPEVTPPEVTPPEVTPPAIPPEPVGKYAQPNPLWGIAIKPDGTPYRFRYVAAWMGFDWVVASDGLAISYVERAGGEVISANALGVLESELAIFEDAVEAKPDAIYLMWVAPDAPIPFVDRAEAAGVPVFEFEQVSHAPGCRSYVTYDHFEMGQIAGRWLVDMAEKRDKPIALLEIPAIMTSPAVIERRAGLYSILDNNPWVSLVVESRDSGCRDEEAYAIVLDAYMGHPEIDAIFSTYAMTGGINEALGSIDKLYPVGDPKHVAQIFVDGMPNSLKSIREGYTDAITAHGPWDQVDIIVKAMLTNVCLGKPVEKEYIVHTLIIDINNIDSPRYGMPMWWGEQLFAEPDIDKWPLLDTSEFIETPTLIMK